MSNDTLSEVLRAVRLTGAVFFTIDASAPWVADTPGGNVIGPHIMPGVEHVIEYHLVTRGSCYGGIVNEEAVRLEAGDVIVFPQGDAHALSSTPGMRRDCSAEFHEAMQSTRVPVRLAMHGGGDRTDVVCGFIGCDARPYNPLLAALPRMLHLPRQTAEDDATAHLVSLAVSESAAPRPGGECVLARLSELLFVNMVRRYLATLPPERRGWLAGLRDELVGRALAKLHAEPAHDFTLEELAREVGASRSVLAERFTQFVGQPPMQYLAQWRMQLASSLLAGTSLGLAEIAERVGYGSEAALSRAFKRWVGVAPADWRNERRRLAASEPSRVTRA